MRIAAILALILTVSPVKAETITKDAAYRQRFVASIDESFLKKGMNVEIAAMGDNKDIFYMAYALSSRAFVYKFVNETTMIRDLEKAGFVQARFSDGHGDNYCLNIKARKFVDCY